MDGTKQSLGHGVRGQSSLQQMGFTENQVYAAFDKLGPNVPISELADSILTGRIADDYIHKDKDCGMGMGDGLIHSPYGLARVKPEDSFQDDVSLSRDMNRGSDLEGKRPKQECYNLTRKRPKQEYLDDFSSFLRNTWPGENNLDNKPTSYELSTPFNLSPSKSIDRVVAKPPYFLYGNVGNVPNESWVKISQFLYAVAPEFVNAKFFSALNRKEGYVHNLPAENRFHIVPKPPMTIEDAIPHTKKWWQSWDTRKQLSGISSETRGVSQLCDRLGKILNDSQGLLSLLNDSQELLSLEKQKDILHHCQRLNLVWVGHHKLSPIEPEHLERILGYPRNHTHDDGSSLTERLQALKHCFQTDTLGYHLSVLKGMYPDGLTMLSVFSGIGGAEVALHRLGVRLKGVVSVEMCLRKRRIMKRWWENTEQRGELVQMEDVRELTTNKLKSLMDKLGGFDLVVCQNPCTSFSLGHVKGGDSDGLTGFNLSLFYEFVRVLQRVRNVKESKS